MPREVSLRSVSFGYDEREVLHEVNLTLARGRITAIIGPNGSGKSTIVNLLLGMYRPRSGALFVDDVPYTNIDVRAFRRQLGVVRQDPVFFAGTVRENICYGYPDASHETVRAAASLATADHFINSLPKKYETFIGEDGILLSGGQRQRLALARAVLRQPTFLILDEPTNHLDSEAVDQLLHNLRSLPTNPGILLITHDLSLIQVADDVLELAADRQTTCCS